jgi:hypothetical protein
MHGALGKNTAISLALLCLLGPGATWASAADSDSPSADNKTPVTQGAKAPQELVEGRIERERRAAELEAQSEPVAEALSAVKQTQAAVKYLDQNDVAKANTAMETALGKMDLVLTKQPKLALVPVSADVRVLDLAIDDQMAKHVARQAKSLVNDGQLQAARKILRNFASEIDIATLNIPMATYPPAIRVASQLLGQGKPQAAKEVLIVAMSSLVLTERSIPLPVVKAEALVDEVNRQTTSGKVSRVDADQLLDLANSQIALARDLGYETRTQDFASIQTSIKQAKASIDQNLQSKSVVAKLKSDIADLKNRIFGHANA